MILVVVVVGLLDAGPKASDVAALLQLLVKRQVATDDNTAACVLGMLLWLVVEVTF